MARGKFSSTREVQHHASSTIKHFSHPHPLEPFSSQNVLTLCSGCKTSQPSGDIMYVCRPCNFILHSTCANLPQLITHPSHPNHTLSLLPAPLYPGGSFKCDACNQNGDGFSFHCNSCEFDLHVLCASKPLEITHSLHQCCLELTFLHNPYKICHGFSCDVCSMTGSNQWLYRCNTCGFDAHLDCATAAAMPSPTTQPQATIQHHNSYPGATLHSQFQASLNAYSRPPTYLHSASVGAVPNYQHQFQPPIVAAGGQVHGSVMPNQLMHSASTGSIPNYRPPIPITAGHAHASAMPNNQFMHNVSTGSMPNYKPSTGNNQASSTGGVMNSAMQGLMGGVAQQIGQTIVQGLFGS